MNKRCTKRTTILSISVVITGRFLRSEAGVTGALELDDCAGVAGTSNLAFSFSTTLGGVPGLVGVDFFWGGRGSRDGDGGIIAGAGNEVGGFRRTIVFSSSSSTSSSSSFPPAPDPRSGSGSGVTFDSVFGSSSGLTAAFATFFDIVLGTLIVEVFLVPALGLISTVPSVTFLVIGGIGSGGEAFFTGGFEGKGVGTSDILSNDMSPIMPPIALISILASRRRLSSPSPGLEGSKRLCRAFDAVERGAGSDQKASSWESSACEADKLGLLAEVVDLPRFLSRTSFCIESRR